MLKRFYQQKIEEHLSKYNQMVFLSGPRQVGKTTLALSLCEGNNHTLYLNWDRIDDRETILGGNQEIAKNLPLDVILAKKPVVIFDELHKFSNWKTFIKGFFDTYKDKLSIIVTGSARLDVYKSGGDSLMGRYFHYRVSPLTVGELVRSSPLKNDALLQDPHRINETAWKALMHFGGFPDPLLRREERFFNSWQNLRHQQFFREDVRDLSRVMEISQMEVLAKVLSKNIGQISNYTTLSKSIRVSDKTVRNWIEILKSLYYCFTLKPWTKNVTRSLVRDPKTYLWDWSLVHDKGQRVENFVASHLLKAVHFWRDFGYGNFDLHFIRDKEKREVDFLLTRNHEPWILVEVKSSYTENLSKNLRHFSETLAAPYSFQVAADLEYQGVNLFQNSDPKIVSMQELLSYFP